MLIDPEGSSRGHLLSSSAPLCDSKVLTKSWASLFASNRDKEKGSELQFIPPVSNGQRFVRFHSSEVKTEEDKWKNVLIGYVYRLQPSIEKLSSFALNRWSQFGLVKVSRINDDLLLLFQFRNESGCDLLLREGLFTFDNHPLIFKKWYPRMNLDISALCFVAIWIQLPGLPWEFSTTDMLSKLGSFCGKPLHCDKCTLSRLKLIGYALILVEMDVNGEFPYSIIMQDESGEILHQKVCYEWRPNWCSPSVNISHLNQDCRNDRKGKQILGCQRFTGKK